MATASPASEDSADSAEDSPSSFAGVARAVGAGKPYAGVLPAVVKEKLNANQVCTTSPVRTLKLSSPPDQI